MAVHAPITGAPSRAPGNLDRISGFMASRRSMLTGTFGAIGATMLATLPAVAAPTITPVMAAIAASKAADARFSGLDPNLETTNPDAFEREEAAMIAAWDAVSDPEPATWEEFVAQLEAITMNDMVLLKDNDQTLMLARARRLLMKNFQMDLA